MNSTACEERIFLFRLSPHPSTSPVRLRHDGTRPGQENRASAGHGHPQRRDPHHLLWHAGVQINPGPLPRTALLPQQPELSEKHLAPTASIAVAPSGVDHRGLAGSGERRLSICASCTGPRPARSRLRSLRVFHRKPVVLRNDFRQERAQAALQRTCKRILPARATTAATARARRFPFRRAIFLTLEIYLGGKVLPLIFLKN
jgi:hypothetical protein